MGNGKFQDIFPATHCISFQIMQEPETRRPLEFRRVIMSKGFPWWLSTKESTCQAGDPGSIPGSRRSPKKEMANPVQYSRLGNPMDRGTWWATVHGVAKSQA